MLEVPVLLYKVLCLLALFRVLGHVFKVLTLVIGAFLDFGSVRMSFSSKLLV